MFIPDCQEIRDYFSSNDRAFDIAMKGGRYSFSLRKREKTTIPMIQFIDRLREITHVRWTKLSDGVFVGEHNPKNILLFSASSVDRYKKCEIILSCGDFHMIYKSEDYYGRDSFQYVKVRCNVFDYYFDEGKAAMFANLSEPAEIIQQVVNYLDLFKTHKHRIPLYHALSNYQIDAAEYLLKQGASQCNKDHPLIRPLIESYRMGAFELIYLLMSYDPPVDHVISLLIETDKKDEEIFRLAFDHLREVGMGSKRNAMFIAQLLNDEKTHLVNYFLPSNVTDDYLAKVRTYCYPCVPRRLIDELKYRKTK